MFGKKYHHDFVLRQGVMLFLSKNFNFFRLLYYKLEEILIIEVIGSIAEESQQRLFMESKNWDREKDVRLGT